MYRPEFFSGLIFITALLFITMKIPFMFTSLSTVHIYDFHTFTVIYCQNYFNRYISLFPGCHHMNRVLAKCYLFMQCHPGNNQILHL